MSTTIRPELSEKNQYWIEKHRYYELKHFCLQYPIWRRYYAMLDGYPSNWPKAIPPCKTNNVSDPVAKKVNKFYCPVCRKDRYISWSDLRKKIVYEGEGSQK